jgi:hypothetical protein
VGSYAATQHTTWAGGFDFTTELNALTMDISFDELDDTRYGHTGRARKAGLESVETQLGGLWSAGTGTPDTEIASTLATTVHPVSHTPTGTVLDVAKFYQAKHFRYSQGGPIGELYPFELNAKNAKGSGATSVGCVHGRLLVAKGNISGTGVAGSVYELGAVSATQYLYAAVHTFAVGTTFTLQIQSDTASNFPSATTQMTIGPITTTGGTWGTRVAGAITDTFWRVNVSAITGTSTVAVVVGIK